MPSLGRFNLASGMSLGLAVLSAHTAEEPWLRADVDAARLSIEVEDVKATAYYLASDALQGRDTPSPGLDIAADYLEARFRAAGLEVLRQSIELDGVIQPPQVAGTLNLGDEELLLDSAEHAAAITGGRPREVQLKPADLVYVGAPSGLFSASTLEPRSKALIVVAEAKPVTAPDPRMPPIGPGELSFFGARLAARAVLYVTPPGPEGDAMYDELVAGGSEPSLGGMRGAQAPVIAVRGSWFLDTLAAALEVKPADIFESAVEPRPLTGMLEANIPAQRTVTMTADNVGALLRGRDESLARETVIVSAHYDHIGLRPSGGGDNICNGADDDASGTTAVVELAAAFAQLEQAPRRSILFLAFCGEEKGLMGSKRYTEDPMVPLEDTVANVNIEMIGRPEDIGPDRAWVTGYSLSDVGQLLAEAAESMDFEVFEHETLSERLFGASDNASLARHGIPAHSISAGSLHDDYHQPSDEVDRLDFENMTEVVRAIFLGTLWIAERDDRPEWDADNPRARSFSERRVP